MNAVPWAVRARDVVTRARPRSIVLSRPLGRPQLRTPARLRTRQVHPPSIGRLHAAVAALFALDGAVIGSWASRVPDVSAAVGATPTTLGLALLCISFGALACMPLTGSLCARFGPGAVGGVAAAVLALSLTMPGLTASVPALCVTLLFFGAATGVVNVAANALGVDVERRRTRPVMSRLHAGFSLGGLAGALLGGLAAAAVPVAWHLVTVALAALVVAVVIGPTLGRSAGFAGSPGPTGTGEASDDTRADARAHAARSIIVLLGVIAGCTAFVEGAVADWSALHLTETLHATPALAAVGYGGFCLAMACGRLGGHRLVARHGDTTLLVGGGLLATTGLLAAGLTTALPVALAGFVLVGLGLANVFPLAIARAGLLDGARGVALASVVGYGGLLAGPPLIGFAADVVGLPSALGSVAALAAAAAALAVVVDVRLSGAYSVAAVLRAQTLARWEPAAARADAAARRQATDLLLLTDHRPGPRRGPSAVPAYPGLEFFTA